MSYKSKAEWPDSLVAAGCDKVTEDTHATKEQAEAVCRMLARDGLGGQGNTFPLRTWVEEAQPVPQPDITAIMKFRRRCLLMSMGLSKDSANVVMEELERLEAERDGLLHVCKGLLAINTGIVTENELEELQDAARQAVAKAEVIQ